MANIVGISGSLRKGSFNTLLLRAAVELAPAGTSVEVESIREFPLYDGDLEERAFPAAVRSLKDRIAAADGLLLVTPEYNHSIPGVFKNAIDWLSRPTADIKRVFGDRPVALMGATPGRGGTALAQAAWLPVLHTLGTRPWFGGRLLVSVASSVFDAEGQLVDEKVKKDTHSFMVSSMASLVSASGPSWPEMASRSELARPRVTSRSLPVTRKEGHITPPPRLRHSPLLLHISTAPWNPRPAPG